MNYARRGETDVEVVCSRLRYSESERNRLLDTIEQLKSHKESTIDCFWSIERMQDNVGGFSATKRYVLGRLRLKVKLIDCQIKTDKAAFKRMQKIAKPLVNNQLHIQSVSA